MGIYYSDSTKGFYDSSIHGKSLPKDAVEITRKYHTALLVGQASNMLIVVDESGYPILKKTPTAPPQIPEKVTMRQARLALHAAGLLNKVEDAIGAIQEPQKTILEIEWNYASNVARNSQFVTSIGEILGLTSVEIDNLFLAAAEL